MALVFLIGAISVISAKGSARGGKNIIYAKDKELHHTYLSKIDPFEMTDRLFENVSDIDGEDYVELSDYIFTSDDERYVFYPDRVDENGMTYYWRDLKADNSSKDAAAKIDININEEPFLTSDGNKFFYVKDDDSRLYVYDRKSGDKTKLDDDVYSFYMDEKGEYIIYSKYIDGEHSTYEMTIKGSVAEKNKIDSNSTIYRAFPNEKKVYYSKDEALYLKEFDKDKVKIASDVEQLVSVVDGKSVYYLKTEEVTNKLSTFINDDMVASDKALQEPELEEVGQEPDYPSEYDYRNEVWQPSAWGSQYNSATGEYGYWNEETDYEAYDDAYQAYLEAYEKWETNYNETMDKYYVERDIYEGKENRDELRLALDYEENAVTYNKYLLYYWNDGKEELVASDLAGSWEYQKYLAASSTKPIVVYQKHTTSSGGSEKLSELVEEWGGYFYTYDVIQQIRNKVAETRSVSEEIFVASQDKESVIDANEATRWSISENGTIYFLDNYNSEKNYGSLMSTTIKNAVAEKPVKIDDDVMRYFEGNNNGKYYYFKDIKNNSGDLYLEGKRIAADVYNYSLYNYEGTDTLIYYKDYRENYNNGTLSMLKGGVETKIADDVAFYSPLDEKNLAYITDYNRDRQKGDLMLHDGKDKPTLVDYDVTGLLWNKKMLGWRASY